jgi:hypothetical protein
LGSLIGFFAALGMIGSAWSGTLDFWGLPIFVIAAIVGVFVLPMTIGTFMASIMFGSPIAFIAGLISGNSNSAFTALGIGVCAIAVQMIIGYLHRGSL